ncbi:MAG: hypothetical protein QXU79_04675 [Candidatus Micrarchaeaceae archaeon]
MKVIEMTEITQGFVDDLNYAKDNNKTVSIVTLIGGSGWHGNIVGKVMSIDNSTVLIKSENRLIRIRINDITRLEIYE